MTRLIATLLLSACAFAARAYDHAQPAAARLLAAHVQWSADGHASTVDYAGLKRQRAALDAVLADYSAVREAEFAGWTRPQQMAFLINAYNLWTLKLIVDADPLPASIRDLGSLLRSPWKRAFIPLLGGSRSLDWIEHERLRPVYRDARVHFAANCASIGCPALRPEPYVADRLDAQLDDQTRRFLSDRSRNRIEADGRLAVSSIFKWYREDFDAPLAGRSGGLEGWLAQHADLLADRPSERARITGGQAPLRFLDYDWRLNGRR